MKSNLLSIVIPSYNEIGNLRKGTLDHVEHYLERGKYNFEVIVVDDGSDDGSLEFVREFAKDNPKFQIIENSHTGKAGAVTAGVLAAQGDYILFTDMDQATPIGEVEELMLAVDVRHNTRGFTAIVSQTDNEFTVEILYPPVAKPSQYD